MLFRPNEAKVKNLKTKDYLGKARLVATSDRSNAFTGFQGSEIKAKIAAEKDDRPPEMISYGATNLVDRTLASRGRQQSEPPMGRNIFPPTPPPEADKMSPTASDGSSFKGPAPTGPTLTGRAASVRSADGGRQSPRPPGPPQRSNTGLESRKPNPFTVRDTPGFGPRGEIGIPPRSENRPVGPAPPPKQTSATSRDQNRSPINEPMNVERGGPKRAVMDDRVGSPPIGQYKQPPRTDAHGNKPMSPPMGTERPRLGTLRTASEPRGPSRQYTSVREREQGPSTRRPMLYRETTDESRMTNSSRGTTDPYNNSRQQPTQEEEYRDELYDMYSSPRSSKGTGQGGPAVRRTRSNNQPSRPNYIPEEQENDNGAYQSDDYEDDLLDNDDGNQFEMLPASNQHHRRNPSGRQRAPEVRKIRVKVHANDDTRYIMIGPQIGIDEFETKIMEKFKMRGGVRVKIMDEGDMVTMGDQDDLDLVVSQAKQGARRERSDMGKMEVSQPCDFLSGDGADVAV